MRKLFRVFCQDQAGSYTILAGLAMPMLVGLSGLGTEVGLWYYKHQSMQAAADSGAVSAATANSGNIADLEMQAYSVAASYGYINGVDGSTVSVNRPPTSGAFTGVAGAVEVIVQQPQARLFTSVYQSGEVLIGARAVATPQPGQGCVLALDPAASAAASFQGSAEVSLNGCGLYSNSNAATSASAGGSSQLSASTVRAVGRVSGQDNMTTTQGIFENMAPTSDPYADIAQPATPGSCTENNFKAKTTVTIGPGFYCGGIDANANAVLTLSPGTYYLNGDLKLNGGAVVNGTGVTLIFTGSGSDYGTARINGGAVVNLTAPTTGPTAGIVIFGDRNMPTGTTFKLNGGSSQYFGGAIYTPRAAVEFSGGSVSDANCTQIIGNTIQFTGNSSLTLNMTNCPGHGTPGGRNGDAG